jgi:hypothetical protein
MNREPQKLNVEQIYRTNLVIWAALFASQLILFVVVYFVRPELFKFDFSISPLEGENSNLVLIFAFLAVSTAALSFTMKSKFFKQAESEQKPALVQSGQIIACALCETSSIFGVVLALAFGYRYFFFWIIFGILGIIAHFPRRDPLIAAAYKR